VPTPTPQFVPWNESQFRLLRNGPTMESYLDFVEQHVFPDGDRDHLDNDDNRLSMLPQEYFDVVGSSADEQQLYRNIKDDDTSNSGLDDEDNKDERMVRPYSLLAGGEVPEGVDASSLRKRTFGMKNIHEELARWREAGKPVRQKKIKKGKVQRARKDLDHPLKLPKYDFWQMDAAINKWIPDNSPDAYQNRLIEFLAFSANADSDVVRESMFKLPRQHRP